MTDERRQAAEGRDATAGPSPDAQAAEETQAAGPPPGPQAAAEGQAAGEARAEAEAAPGAQGPAEGELHPAEHRGWRELYASASQLVRHWEALADRLPDAEASGELRSGAAAAARLLDELAPTTAAYGLHGEPAAEGLGTRWAGTRIHLRDRTLDRNQALRLSLLDIQHLTTLLLYLAALADRRQDDRLATFCRRWERTLRRIENAVRRAAAAAGADADWAIQPLDTSAVGRAAHGAAHAVGTLGEWIDRRRAERSTT